MILSTKHRFIFWHVPKAAGQSITHMLAPFGVNQEHIFGKDWGHKYRFKNRLHINQADFRNEIANTGLQIKNYKEFAFVRHPYASMVSKYNYFNLVQVDQHNRPAPDRRGLFTMDQFIQRQITRTDGSWTTFPQTHWTLTPFGINSVKVFKVENLPQSWNQVQEYINLELPSLVHYNSSEHSMTVGQLTQGQKDCIYEHFKSDFEAFGYER